MAFRDIYTRIPAHRRILARSHRRPRRAAPAHAAPGRSVPGLLWWLGGLGALILLAFWIGSVVMSPSGQGGLADAPPATPESSASPDGSAEPTPEPSGSPDAGGSGSDDCDTGRTGCVGGGTTGTGTATTVRSPRPSRSASPRVNDPRYASCAEAKAHGYGPYVRGEDPEYGWYRQEDTDNDGVVCR